MTLFILINTLAQSQSFNRIEKKIDSLIENNLIPSFAIGILKDGEVIYEKAFGYADRQAGVKSTINTSYQLASLSKPITATAIMKLHEEGKINLDDPITKYITLNKVDSSLEDPTIRQVLNHTSGLGTYFDIYYEDEKENYTSFDEAWKKFGTQFHAPGIVCEYSNLGYGLLDHIISQVTSETFQHHMRESLLSKLQMDHSFVLGNEGDRVKDLAVKYDHELKPLPLVKNNTPGAGNVASSIHDIMQFAKLHLGSGSEDFLTQESINAMHYFKEPNALFHYYQSTYYGLGWYAMENDQGRKVVWHEGGMTGASTSLKLYPEENIAIALLTNTYNPNVCRTISDELTKLLIHDYDPTPINEVADYKLISSDDTFYGSWEGSIYIDDEEIPVSLTLDDSGIELEYLDYGYVSFMTDYQPIPVRSKLLFGMINQDYFIGSGVGDLNTANQRDEFRHLLSFKLFKEGNALKGTIVNMAAADREYYARPYFINLEKVGSK